MKRLSWKARRQGEIYCSPACGRGCTIAEYNKARYEALRLAVRLSSIDTDVKGGRWKIRVHENLGWYFSVSKGNVTVHKHGPSSYSATLNISGPWGGNMVTNAKTPEEAVRNLLAEARAQLVPMVALAAKLAKENT